MLKHDVFNSNGTLHHFCGSFKSTDLRNTSHVATISFDVCHAEPNVKEMDSEKCSMA